jgi:peptidoglycan/LPS O-acetylase OafA/YrhL
MIGLAAGFELWRGPLTSFAREWFWHGKTVSEDPWDWVNYLSPYLRILDFLSGMLMAQAYRLGAGKSLPSVALPIALFWCGAAFVIYWLHAAPLADLVPNFLFVPAIAPLMLHLSTRESRLSRLLAGKTATFLGEISYSIYIWSFFVITMLGEMFGHAHPITIAYFNSGPKVIGICAMTIVVAYGSYHLIEAPARRYLRTVLSP